MPHFIPIPPPNRVPFPGGPDQVRKVQLRWADLAAFELICRAKRVVDRTHCFHLCQGRQIHADLDPRHDRRDTWSWVRGTSCPRYHEDHNEIARLEAIARADGMDESYAFSLAAALIPGRSTPPKSPDTPSPAELFRLLNASPENRLLALIDVYLRGIANGQLTS